MYCSQLKIRLCILALLITSLLLPGSGAGKSAVAAQTSCGSWRLVKSPDVTSDNELNAVAVVSTQDVWAVGQANKGKSSQTLIEHWNGSAWSVISSPNPHTASGLLGVSAVSSSDVWAAGFAGAHNLIEHWNGTSWSVVKGPHNGLSDELYSVAAISAKDVWAVGQFVKNQSSFSQTLTEHWNGTSWSVVKSPDGGSPDELLAVTATAQNDVWAVGEDSTYTGLIEHWNGNIWSLVANPARGLEDYLYAVSASAANDVWAVGYTLVNTVYKTLVEHWNGSKWSIVRDLNPGIANDMLNAVDAISANDVWAVGSYKNPSRLYDKYVFTEHWDGRSWHFVKSVNPGSFEYTLYAITQAPGTNTLWAVGEWRYHFYAANKTLAEVYC